MSRARNSRVNLLVAVCVGALSALPSYASPLLDLAFAVDSAASSLGSPISVPLNGTVNGSFQKFDRTLTFDGGNNIGLASALVTSAVIPDARVVDTPGTTVDIMSGSVSAALPGALHLGLTGAVSNGDPASAVTWTAQGPGTISGSVVVLTSVFGVSTSTNVGFSAIATPASTFTTPAAAGSIALTDTAAGSRLTVPLALPVTVSDIDVQGSGVLGAFFEPVRAFLANYIDSLLSSLSPLPGTVAANSATHLPALPQDVTYTVDPTRSFFSGISTGALAGTNLGSSLMGTVGARLLDGDLKFAGESAFGFSRQLGPIDNFAVGSLGALNYDVDLSSLSLVLGFGLASGYASNGSSPADLGWVLNGGTITMSGRTSLQLGGFGIVDAPFSVTSDLGLIMQLRDAGPKVQLVRDLGVETLTIPLSFDGVDASLSNTHIDIDDGVFGFLAGAFATQLVPFLENIVLNDIETADYSGVLIATRGAIDPIGGDPGGPGNPVPAPPTSALMAAGFLAWRLMRVRRGKLM